MKKIFIAIALLALPVFAADSPQHGGVLGVPGGRYVFGQIGDSILSTFMLDTQTGRLWKYQADDKRGLVLAPITYALADGTVSLAPVDTKDELDHLEKRRALEKQIKEKGQNDGK